MFVRVWVVVSTHLKRISQIRSFPQVGMKIFETTLVAFSSSFCFTFPNDSNNPFTSGDIHSWGIRRHVSRWHPKETMGSHEAASTLDMLDAFIAMFYEPPRVFSCIFLGWVNSWETLYIIQDRKQQQQQQQQQQQRWWQNQQFPWPIGWKKSPFQQEHPSPHP